MFCKCGCGSTKIENRDLGLCATSNKARLKAEKEPKPKKVYTLKQTPIKQVSTKKAAAIRIKEKAQKEMRKQNIRYCETCGDPGHRPLSHSHILPVGQFPQFEATIENQLYECYGDSDSCHNIYEVGDFLQVYAQSTFSRKVKVMHKLAPEYLRQRILNWSKTYPFEKINKIVEAVLNEKSQ